MARRRTEPTDEMTPVIVYLRKSHGSDTKQEESIPRQRAEVFKFCEGKRYQVIAEYSDHASGSKDQEKRVEFRRMLVDIAAGTPAKVVVCWNRARFGRLDAYDGADPVKILRSNGLILDTVKEGEFDFKETGGRWKDFAFSEAAKEYAISISADSLSGRLAALRAGYWCNGAVPYGYDRQYVDSTGEVVAVVPRRIPTTRPARSKLKLAENTAEANIVRELFAQFADGDTSLLALASNLTKRKIPSPDTLQKKSQRTASGNEGWNSDTIKAILKNRAYLGIGSIGRGRKREVFNKAEFLEVPGVCPALITPELFARVQAKFGRNAEAKRNIQPAKAGLLSGFVYCGHCRFRCGKREDGDPDLRPANMPVLNRYICSSPGKRPHLGCRQWSVREDALLPLVLDGLIKNIDAQMLVLKEARPADQKVTDREIIQTQHDRLKQDIDKATRNYLKAPDHLLGTLSEHITEMKKEVLELERRLQLEDAMKPNGALAGLSETWDKFKKQFSHLMNSDDKGDDELKRFKKNNIDGQIEYLQDFVKDGQPFRAMLDALGVRIWVYWKGEKGYFPEIARVELEVEFSGATIETSPIRTRTTTGIWSTAWRSARAS